jgi:hypothetical protein
MMKRRAERTRRRPSDPAREPVKLKEPTPAPPRREENLHPLLALLFRERLAAETACVRRSGAGHRPLLRRCARYDDFETERADAVARIASSGSKDYDGATLLQEPRPATHSTVAATGAESSLRRRRRFFRRRGTSARPRASDSLRVCQIATAEFFDRPAAGNLRRP